MKLITILCNNIFRVVIVRLNFVVSIFFTITEIEYQYVKTHFNLCFLQYTPRNNSMPTQDTPHLKPTQARTTTDPSTDRTTTEHVTR